MKRNLTLFESIIIVVIIGILAAIVLPFIIPDIRTTCRNGYLFTKNNGIITLIIDEDGYGVKCQ